MAAAKKRRRRRKLPGIQEHSSGQGRVCLSGQTFYLGKYGTPEAHARYAALVDRWLANGRRPLRDVATVDRLVPMRQLAKVYLEHIEKSGRYLKDGAATSQRGLIETALASFCEQFGDVRADRFDARCLHRWRDDLLERTTLTRSGLNRRLGLVKAWLRWAYEREALNVAQAHAVSLVRPLSKAEAGHRDVRMPKRAPTVAEIEAVAAALPPTPAAMLRLQALTGARPGEVCSLRWRDIDRTPVAVDGVVFWRWKLANGKTAHHGRQQVYPISPAARAILEALEPSAGLDDFVFRPAATVAEVAAARRAARRTPITKQTAERDAQAGEREYGDHYSTRDYRQALARGAKRAGVEAFSGHEVRHAAVTAAVALAGPHAARALAGHADLATTSRYAHSTDVDAFRAALAIERRSG
jgi:integrase